MKNELSDEQAIGFEEERSEVKKNKVKTKQITEEKAENVSFRMSIRTLTLKRITPPYLTLSKFDFFSAKLSPPPN